MARWAAAVLLALLIVASALAESEAMRLMVDFGRRAVADDEVASVAALVRAVRPRLRNRGLLGADVDDQAFQEAITRLKALSGVVAVREEGTVRLSSLYLQPAALLWNLDLLSKSSLSEQNNYYEYDYTGAGVDVYVLDTGIRVTHQEFEDRAACFASYIDGTDPDDCYDPHGHGTHVAGVVGGATYGVAKKASLWAARVLDEEGYGSEMDVLAALWDIADDAPDGSVIVMSFVGENMPLIDEALQYAVERNKIPVAAAGNYGEDACGYMPAASSFAISVGAHKQNGARADFSNWGTCVAVYAPGTDIRSASRESDTATTVMSGTSAACPHVAGIAALAREANPTLYFDGVRDILVKHVKPELVEPDIPNGIAYSRAPFAPCGAQYCGHVEIALSSTVRETRHFTVSRSGYLDAYLDVFDAATHYRLTLQLRSADGVLAEVSNMDGALPVHLRLYVDADSGPVGLWYSAWSDSGSTRGILFSAAPLQCSAEIDCNGEGSCSPPTSEDGLDGVDGSCDCFENRTGNHCEYTDAFYVSQNAMTVFLGLFSLISIGFLAYSCKKERSKQKEIITVSAVPTRYYVESEPLVQAARGYHGGAYGSSVIYTTPSH